MTTTIGWVVLIPNYLVAQVEDIAHHSAAGVRGPAFFQLLRDRYGVRSPRRLGELDVHLLEAAHLGAELIDEGDESRSVGCLVCARIYWVEFHLVNQMQNGLRAVRHQRVCHQLALGR